VSTSTGFVLPQARRQAGAPLAPVSTVGNSAALDAVPAEPAIDNQVYAAAELVRLGLATRVTLVNAAVDPALPDTWEILGTPICLARSRAGRVRLTAGPR
jgi:hypothetical protein